MPGKSNFESLVYWIPFVFLMIIVVGVIACEIIGSTPTINFKSLLMFGLDRQVKLLG